MIFYAIYYNPIEFPNRFVTRPWLVEGEDVRPQSLLAVCDTLEAARAVLPNERIWIDRQPEDDISLVETWI